MSTATRPIPSGVDLDGPITADRKRAWVDAYTSNRIADAVWFPDTLTSFHGRLRRRPLRDLLMIDIEADPFGSLYANDSAAAQYVGVSINTRDCRERVVLGDGREIVLSSSQIDVWDASLLREAEILSPMRQTVVLVPKPVLRMSRCSSLWMPDELSAQDSASMTVLRSVVLAVAAEAVSLGEAATAAARNAIVELLLCIVHNRQQPSGGAARVGLRSSILRWIDDSLQFGQVSPAAAAERHNISIRTLHRLFSDSGETFGTIVRTRRLDCATRELLRSNDMIQSIAMRWGYADASQFINEFKRAHGSTPTAYRAAARAAAAA